MKKIILLEFIAIVISYVSLDNLQHCDCTELSESECTQQLYWCKWSNNTCISHNQNCENLTTSSLCLNSGFHCTWDSKNLNCSSYQCSNFTGSDDCLTHNKCYWFNKTCSDTFTNCTDYTSDTCSYLTDQNCIVNDTKCVLKEFPANCTDDANCIEDFTSAAKTYKCVLKESKCYEIDVSDPCPTFNDSQTICESYSQCFYYDATTTESTEDSSICRQKQCTDTIDQTTCESLIALDNNLEIYCEWVDDKCQNMKEAMKYNEDNCFKSTLYNYKWNGANKICEQCKSLIANTPIYESINNTNQTNSTNTTINDTVIVSTDPVQINPNKRCSCRLFYTQEDCQDRSGCQWEIYSCKSLNYTCSSKNSDFLCRQIGCIWTQYSTCQEFQGCNYYDSEQCPLEWGCYPQLNGGCSEFVSCSLQRDYCPSYEGCVATKNGCEKAPACQTYAKEDCQRKYQSRNYPCYLANDGKCKTKFTLSRFDICEDFDDSIIMCQSMIGCAYVGNKCVKGKCYQFPKDNCYYQRNSDGNLEICEWNEANHQCDYDRLSNRTKYTCYEYNLYWTNKCEMCTDLEDYYPVYGVRQFLVNILIVLLIIN